MWRTGYWRSWDKASRGLGSAGGPVYWLMRVTIGSTQDPIVRPVHIPRTLEEAEAMMLAALTSLR